MFKYRHKKCSVSFVNYLLQKIDRTGSVERKASSGRPWFVWTKQNMWRVSELICSPDTSESPREIEKWSGLFAAVLCCVAYAMRSKNMRTFYHCVSSVTVVLWQKVNLGNNYLTFLDKMDIILCENNLHLKWHFTQHCAFTF